MSLSFLEKSIASIWSWGRKESELNFPFQGLYTHSAVKPPHWLIVGKVDKTLFSGFDCEFTELDSSILSGVWRAKVKELRLANYDAALAIGELPFSLYVLPYFANVPLRIFIGDNKRRYPYYNILWLGSIEGFIEKMVNR